MLALFHRDRLRGALCIFFVDFLELQRLPRGRGPTRYPVHQSQQQEKDRRDIRLLEIETSVLFSELLLGHRLSQPFLVLKVLKLA